ncbi:PAS domain-containing protein [Aestuariivivens sediminicola]|uniref:PAS domain-containing protein n=1 Tax=Aestuariivivens sediminicola TaxID=2913560 RepID=UPI001F55F050|nr:PAS domain S-box protein [Aestuariivivens sediminicola]
MALVKISYEKKIVLGYIINLMVVFALGLIYWKQMPQSGDAVLWDWILLALIVLSLGMLTVVYVILKAQQKANTTYAQELLQSQTLLQSIIDNTPNPISVKKLNGEYLLVNTQYQMLFREKTEDLIGKTNHDVLDKETADRYRSTDLDALKTGREIQVEETFEQADGTHIYLSVKFPLFDNSGRAYAIGNISTDITERKKIEQSLKAADTFFNLSVDSLVIASKEKFIKVNPSLSKLLGYSDAELLAKPFTDFIHADDTAATKKEIEKLEKGTDLINFINRWVCKDGSIKWLSWNATADVCTGTLYAIVRDVTAQLMLKEKEEKERNMLFESRQKLNMILENISDGVIVANAEKQVVLANHNANLFFGIQEDTEISMNFSDHFEVLYPDGETPFPAQNLPAERALLGEVTDDVDVLLRDYETNKKRRVLLSGRPIWNHENAIVAVVVTMKDISRYKKLEAELKKKDMASRTIIGFKKSKQQSEKS